MSASVAAFRKIDMKPSFTPWSFSNRSLYCFRSAMKPDMSTSLKVVSIAVFCEACNKPLGDARAQARHRHAPFAALAPRTGTDLAGIVVAARGGRRRRGRRGPQGPGLAAGAGVGAGAGAIAGRCRRALRRSAVTRVGDVTLHVLLADAAVLAGAADVSGTQAVLLQQLAHRRAGLCGVTLGTAGGGGFGFGRRCLLGGFGIGRRGSGTRRLDRADHLVRLHGGALGLDDLAQHAVLGSRHFQHHLVGLHVDQHLRRA